MKQLRLLAGLCLLASLLPYARGQTIGPQTITGTGCTPGVDVSKQATIGMQVTGSWSGTIQPEASIGGQSPVDVQVVPSTSSTAQSTITGNGVFTATVSGYSTFYLCGDTVTGTATIYFNVTQTSSLGRSAGGSGGTPGGTSTQVQYNDNGVFGGITGSSVTSLGQVAFPLLATSHGPTIALGVAGGPSVGFGSDLISNGLDMFGGTFNMFDQGNNLRGLFEASSQLTALEADSSNAFLVLGGDITTLNTNAGIVLSASPGLTATSGTQIGVNVSGDAIGKDVFRPTSGNANFIDLMVMPAINQSGGANGTITVLGAYPLNTALGGTEYLLGLGTASAQGNTATLTNKFTVDNSGNLIAAGTLTLPATSAGTPGVSLGSGGNVGIATHTTGTLDLLGGTFNFYNAGGVLDGAISVGSSSFEISSAPVNSSMWLFGNVTSGTTHAGVDITAGGNNMNASSGNQVAVSISGDIGADAFTQSGTATLVDLFVNPKINTTSSGAATIVGVYPLNTAVGGTEYLLGLGTASSQANSATLTNEFTVDSSGNVVAQGVYSAGATPGVSGASCLGAIAATNGLVTTCSAVSDPRLKVFHPSIRGLSSILQLQPIDFRYNSTGLRALGISPDKNSQQTGFNAANVKAVMPEAVGTETHDGVDYLNLPQGDRPIVAALVNAVKEQQKEIAQLRREVRALRSK